MTKIVTVFIDLINTLFTPSRGYICDIYKSNDITVSTTTTTTTTNSTTTTTTIIININNVSIIVGIVVTVGDVLFSRDICVRV